MTTHYPPTSGTHQDNYSVEVSMQFTYNNLIMGGSQAVTVRSVATCSGSSAAYTPMILLEPSAAKSFWVNSGKLTLNSSYFMVNSSSSTAAATVSSAACSGFG